MTKISGMTLADSLTGEESVPIIQNGQNKRATTDMFNVGDGGGGGYSVVTELPETIEEGVILLYNKTLWRGLLEGESSLPAGTPWPVKGYKEISFKTLGGFDEVLTPLVFIDDIGIQIHLYASDEGITYFQINAQNPNSVLQEIVGDNFFITLDGPQISHWHNAPNTDEYSFYIPDGSVVTTLTVHWHIKAYPPTL